MKKTLQGFNVLDLENDPLAIRPGDYRSALDISLLSDGNGVTQSVEPVLGNQFTGDMGSVAAQSQIMRIQLATGAGTYSLIFKRPNYITLATVSIAQNASAATTVSNAITAITAAIPEATIVNSSTTDVYVDVLISDASLIQYWEWQVFNNSATLAEFTILQEAIDFGAAGVFKPIGSFDLLGDLFVWGATVADVPATLNIVAITEKNGMVELEVPNHGIGDGFAVSVSGVTDDSGNALNGVWIAQSVINGFGVIDADRFVLYGTTYDAPYVLSNPRVTINVYSMGRIIVSQEDVIAGTFTNTVLLTSKELNLRVKKQVDTYCEFNSQYRGLYFTDGFNPIRVLYYYGAYATNGFLTNYSYGTIGAESRLLLQDTNVTLAYNSTITGVGQLKSGDYRYAVRFVTAGESATGWTQLSNIINIYEGPLLVGDVDGTVTSRANVFDVTGIPSGLFKYIELAYVIYQGEANAAFSAGRFVITGPSMQLTHTGFGTETEVDLGTLQSANAGYETAESIDVLNNKMIISNLTTNQIRDFSAFAQTLTHALEQDTITNVGISTTTAFDNYKFGEYFDTQNTYHKKTFVYNETYRFALQVKLKNGPLLSNNFWIDDIRIDTNVNNNLADPTSNRRTAGLPNYLLVDFAGSEDIYVAKVVFGNIDWNYPIDGIRLIDLVERIYINQVEMTSQYKEILGTGLCVYFGRASENAATTGNYFGAAPANCQVPNGWAAPGLIGEFNWFTGNTELTNGTVPGTFPNQYNDARVDKTEGIKYVSFYSPDDYFNNESFDYRSGDRMLQFLEQQRTVIDTDQANQGVDGNAFKGKYQELLGSATSSDPLGTASDISLNDVRQVAAGGTETFGAVGISVSKTSFIGWEDTNLVAYTSVWNAPSSPVCYAQSGFATTTTGHNYGQYYRPKGFHVKFGDKTESKYVPTGAFIDAPAIGVVETVEVFGDSFTQSSFYKLRAPLSGSTPFDGVPNHFYKNGWGYQTMFYSQNRVNSQMRYPLTGLAIDITPYISIDQWNNSANFDVATTSYTSSFTPRNQVNVLPAYDPDAIDTTKFPTRIAYSQTKPNGSSTDEYRDFKPLDFRDLDMVSGEIIHHEISNGQLLTWQQRSFQRQYFNDTGALVSADGSEVIMGDGGALTRRGVTLSSIGTTHKWSIVKGVSKGGNDVMAWWNTEYGYVVRFGYDGVNPISYVHNINGFVDKNTKWVDLRHTPADDEGIRGVWNDERKEYIWTIRGFKTNKGRFNPRKYYATGDTVWVYEGITQTPNIYKALQETRVLQTITLPPVSIFVNNGDFSAGLGFWTVSGGGFTAVTGAARYTNPGSTNFFGAINQNLGVVIGTTYDVTFTISNFTDTSGNLEVRVGFNSATAPFIVTANGTYTVSLLSEFSAALVFSTISNGTGDTFDVSNITVFRPAVTTTSSIPQPVTDPDYWELQTSPLDRNQYTLAFSEFKNGFSCYYSFLPLFYAKWKKSYESNPAFFPQNLYIHNRGAYSRWYGGFVISKPYIMAVLNDNPNDKKSYNAIELNSLLEPNSNGNAIDFFTEQHISYLLASDFEPDELHDIMRASWIKNDATVTAENPSGLNDLDTSELFGEYLLLKFYFTPEMYNKLFAMTVSYQMRSRMNNT
jgi:hypothetical protein